MEKLSAYKCSITFGKYDVPEVDYEKSPDGDMYYRPDVDRYIAELEKKIGDLQSQIDSKLETVNEALTDELYNGQYWKRSTDVRIVERTGRDSFIWGCEVEFPNGDYSFAYHIGGREKLIEFLRENKLVI